MSSKKEIFENAYVGKYADFGDWVIGVDMSLSTDQVIKRILYGEHKEQTTFDFEEDSERKQIVEELKTSLEVSRKYKLQQFIQSAEDEKKSATTPKMNLVVHPQLMEDLKNDPHWDKMWSD